MNLKSKSRHQIRNTVEEALIDITEKGRLDIFLVRNVDRLGKWTPSKERLESKTCRSTSIIRPIKEFVNIILTEW